MVFVCACFFFFINLLWDFDIRNDFVIEARHPNIVLINKRNHETFIIDEAIPENFRVRDEEAKKLSDY